LEALQRSSSMNEAAGCLAEFLYPRHVCATADFRFRAIIDGYAEG